MSNKIIELSMEVIELRTVLKNLADNINIDKDGDYFICKENKELLDKLFSLVQRDGFAFLKTNIKETNGN